MKKQDKIFTVQNLTERLKEAKSVILVDYRGLTVAQINQLRSQVKGAGGELTVVKNNLLKLALEAAGFETKDLEFDGPTAIAIALGDELEPLKIISKFNKEAGIPGLKSGFWDDRVLRVEELDQLAVLPGHDQLVSKLIGSLASPTIRLLGSLSTNQRKFIYILKNKTQGGEN